MKKKITLKAKVLTFVEEQGAARYTDIIKFIVDTKFGKGTYDSGERMEDTWITNSKGVYEIRPRKRNRWRGYFSAAFSGIRPYMLLGPQSLVKGEDGLYRVYHNC